MVQKGGYYPSVFEGVRNAALLMPLVARQAMRLYESQQSRRRKGRKGSKGRIRKTRKITRAKRG